MRVLFASRKIKTFSYIRQRRNFRFVGSVSLAMFAILLFLIVFPVCLKTDNSEATTKNPTPSSMALTVHGDSASVSFDTINRNGSFATSDSDHKVSYAIRTSNATGYTLRLKVDGSTTVLASSTGNTINTIGRAVSYETFSGDSASSRALNNTWGIIPSKYNGTANTTNYYPASTTGFIIDETNSANNETINRYTVGVGVRADYNLQSGTYINDTLVAELVANPVTYSINYYKNTTATVTNMPTINPQTGVVSSPTLNSGSIITTLADAPTRAGYTFIGWCLGSSSTVSNITTTAGVDNCSSTVYDAGQSFGINASGSSPDTYYLFAMWSGNQYVATIYYNNKASNDTIDDTPNIASYSGTCIVQSVNGNNGCSVIIPSSVINSVGQYNNAYAGVANITGTMNTVNNNNMITITADSDYYAVYSGEVAIHKPNSLTDTDIKNVYRNQWFTSKTTMSDAVLAETETGTLNWTYSPVVTEPVYGLYGFRDTPDDHHTTHKTIAILANSGVTTAYAIERANIDVTIYYQSNPTSGYTTISSVVVPNVGRYLYPTATGVAIHDNQVTLPEEVSSSVGTYNNGYVGLASSSGTMTTTNSLTSYYTAYYAVYRTPVTNYYYNGTSYAERVLYRNQWFASAASMSDTVLSDMQTGTTNVTTERGPGGSVFRGLTNRRATSHTGQAPTFENIEGAASSDDTVLYSVYKFEVHYRLGDNTSLIASGADTVSDSTGRITASCFVHYNMDISDVDNPDTGCVATSPYITPNEYSLVDGWYDLGGTYVTGSHGMYRLDRVDTGDTKLTLYGRSSVKFKINGSDADYLLNCSTFNGNGGCSEIATTYVDPNDDSKQWDIRQWAVLDGDNLTRVSDINNYSAVSGTTLYGFTDTLHIYMGTTGNDSRSGLSSTDSVASAKKSVFKMYKMGKKLNYGVSNGGNKVTKTEIHIASGVYEVADGSQEFKFVTRFCGGDGNEDCTNYTDNNTDNCSTEDYYHYSCMTDSMNNVKILGAGNCNSNSDVCANGTIFRGSETNPESFMGFDNNPGTRLNVVEVANMVITRYQTGIVLRHAGAGSSIHDVTFYKIGSEYVPGATSSALAVIELNSTSDVSIYNCVINSVKNRVSLDPSQHVIHGFYIANGSTGNHIYNNRIMNYGGEPVDVRNGSHDNYIYNNTFKNAGTRAYMVAYTNSNNGEVASYDNYFLNNNLYRGFHFPDGGEDTDGDGVGDGYSYTSKDRICTFYKFDYDESTIKVYGNNFDENGTDHSPVYDSETGQYYTYDFPKTNDTVPCVGAPDMHEMTQAEYNEIRGLLKV